jgi:hypothetical protein
MRTLLCILGLLAVCLGLEAQTVTLDVSLANFQVTPTTNRAVKVAVLNLPSVNSGSVIIQDLGILTTDMNGNLSITNAINNSLWEFTVLAPPNQTVFRVLVLPNASGTINASNTLAASSTATFPAGTVAWAAAASDNRYIMATNSLPNGYLAFTTNGGVTFGPSSGNVDSTALHQANNLSDVANVGTSQTNLLIFTNTYVTKTGTNNVTGIVNVSGTLELNATNISLLFVPHVAAGSGIVTVTNGDGSVVVSTNGSGGTGSGNSVAVSTGLGATTNGSTVTVFTNGVITGAITNVTAGANVTVTPTGATASVAVNSFPYASLTGVPTAPSVVAGTGITVSGSPAYTVNTNGAVSAAVTAGFVQTNESRPINLSNVSNTISGNVGASTNYQMTNLTTFNVGNGQSYTNFGGGHGQLLVPLISGQPYFYANTNQNYGLIILKTNYNDAGAVILSNNTVFYPPQANASFLSFVQTSGPVQDGLYQLGPVTNYGSFSGVLSGWSTNFNGGGISNLGTISGAALLSVANQFSQAQNWMAGGTFLGPVSFGTLSANSILALNNSSQATTLTVGAGLSQSGTTLTTNGGIPFNAVTGGAGITATTSGGTVTVTTNGVPPVIMAGAGLGATTNLNAVTITTNGSVAPGVTNGFVQTNDARGITLAFLNPTIGTETATNSTVGTQTVSNLAVLNGSLSGITNAVITNETVGKSTITTGFAGAMTVTNSTNINANMGTVVITNANIVSGVAALSSATITSENVTASTIQGLIEVAGSGGTVTNTNQFVSIGTITNAFIGTGVITNSTTGTGTITNIAIVRGAASGLTTTNATNYNLAAFAAAISQLSLGPGLATTLTNGPNPDVNPGTNNFLVLSGYTTQAGVSGFVVPSWFTNKLLIIEAQNPNTLVISNQSLFESTTTNRIFTGTGGDVTLNGPMVMAAFIYDINSQRWLLAFVNAGANSLTTPITIPNGGTGQTTAAAALVALGGTNGIVNMTGANGAFQDMSNAPATYQGETGRSLGGVGSVYYFNAAGAGTGSMVWGGYANWPGGVGEIGDQLIDLTNTAFNAPTGNGVTTGGNLNINFRGGPNGTRETNVWNGSTTVDSYMFVNNMNPFDSGASFGVRSADTNLSAIGASPLLTNVDGVVIGLPQFGFDMIDIPFSYPIGLNNQAGSDVLIFAKPFMGVSMNITFSSNGTSYPGQYSAFLIDNRYQSNSSFPLMVDFPVLNGEGGTYLPVQSLWQNAFAVDEINNITYASTNTTNGVFNANLGNLNKLSVGQFAIHGVPQTATNHFLINSTNGGEFDTAGNYPALWTFDYAGDSGAQRLGVGVTTAYPNWVYAKGAEFDIQQASISDLSTGIGGATFTNEFHLKNGVVTLTGGITTQGTATGTITATGWTNTTGTNCYVSAIGAVSIVIHDNAGTAWATNTGFSTGEIIPLQAGGSITAASGLTGTWHVQ